MRTQDTATASPLPVHLTPEGDRSILEEPAVEWPTWPRPRAETNSRASSLAIPPTTHPVPSHPVSCRKLRSKTRYLAGLF